MGYASTIDTRQDGDFLTDNGKVFLTAEREVVRFFS